MDEGIGPAKITGITIVHHDRADDRLAHALNILAESFRFAGPAILRWCHDFQGSVPSYHEALEQRRTRFLRTVKPLVQDLAAA